MATVKQLAVAVRNCRQASAIYFPGDAAAQLALEQCERIQFAGFDAADSARLAGETVFVVSDEALLEQQLKRLRMPNVRVIAISNRRFRNARLDGAVYAYLPFGTPPALLERMFDNAVDHMHLVTTRREANDKLALANTEIQGLNQIGAALSAEYKTEELLELILNKCRRSPAPTPVRSTWWRKRSPA
jgi:hypothetical protein